MAPMAGYTKQPFSAALSSGHSIPHDVYRQGNGPIVVIIQELPGIGQETLKLADEFQSEGFRVVIPHLFGPLGKTALATNTLRVLCLRREFRMFQKGETSPIVDWLRALCKQLKKEHQVSGVGVIGMCLTGNFAISLMADEAVLAGVASQPSLPVQHPADLHMSEADITNIRQRLDQHGPMLAYRFEGDSLCKADRFQEIDDKFNHDRERVRLKTIPGKGHAVLTLDFVNQQGHPTRQALDEVITYFRTALTENHGTN